MQLGLQAPLFPWRELDDPPDLRLVRQVLAALPDGALLASLRAARGKGRNDYPIEWLWGVLVLTHALRHPTIEACLAELRRNEGLRALLQIPTAAQVPKAWNVSRFQAVLGEPPHRDLLEQMFVAMAARLAAAVPALGTRLAGDSTALKARHHAAAGVAEDTAAGLSQPSGGKKEYTDDTGKVVKSFEWFGYKLHLLVDAVHEVALAYTLTSPKQGDGETLPTLLAQLKEVLPAGRAQTLAYDKAADSAAVHQALRAAQIKPVIELRHQWQEATPRPLPGRKPEALPVVHYDELGTIYCEAPAVAPGALHQMQFVGREQAAGTLKYRCPALAGHCQCPAEKLCNQAKIYGATVRVKQDLDLRRFATLPRATAKFDQLYDGRTAVERVNARLKVLWGADDGNVTGARRFAAQVGVVMVVHEAFATVLAATPRLGPGKTLGAVNLGPIQAQLQAALAAQATPRLIPQTPRLAAAYLAWRKHRQRRKPRKPAARPPAAAASGPAAPPPPPRLRQPRLPCAAA